MSPAGTQPTPITKADIERKLKEIGGEGDDPQLQALLPRLERRVVTYGMATQADLVAAAPRLQLYGPLIQVVHRIGALDLATRLIGSPTAPVPLLLVAISLVQQVITGPLYHGAIESALLDVVVPVALGHPAKSVREAVMGLVNLAAGGPCGYRFHGGT